MELESLRSPASFLRRLLGDRPELEALASYEAWLENHGRAVSDSVDRAGGGRLRMFDRFGRRVDEIVYPDEYWNALGQGYEAGAVWKAFEAGGSTLTSNLLHFVTCFYDPGLCCPYVVSLATAAAVDKYGSKEARRRFLPPLVRPGADAWQGATWMTEAAGGSDLGAAVVTTARRNGRRWLLRGEKFFASNVGAELAVVAARPEDAAADVRGLALFLLPRRRDDGSLNYRVRRLKDKIATHSVPTGEVELDDSEAWLLGRADQGVYLILETLNISRVANAMGSVGLALRAAAEALEFAQHRVAFGKPVLEHPLLRSQFEERAQHLRLAFALAWESARRLADVWREKPPYSAAYHCFRLVAHLAKFWTAELAAQTAKWAMEVHGGAGVLAEFSAERWFREAMVFAIWEGTCHRQLLDAWEAIERKGAHRRLLDDLAPFAPAAEIRHWREAFSSHLALAREQQEARVAGLLVPFTRFLAETLARRLEQAR